MFSTNFDEVLFLIEFFAHTSYQLDDMKLVISVVLFATAAMSAFLEPSGEKPIYDINKAPELFEDFAQKYNKKYKDEADKQEHFEAFKHTLQVINKGNSDKTDTASYDINELSDITNKERHFLYGARVPIE